MIEIQPCLIVVFGLPGTGKTTLAKALAGRLGWTHYNTDIIRTELGKRHQYDAATKAYVYRQMLERTASELEQGRGVVLDGTFYRDTLREPCRILAQEYHIPLKWVEVLASESVIRDRVSGPRPYSEADFEVYLKIKEEFEALDGHALKLSSDTLDLATMIDRALTYLST